MTLLNIRENDPKLPIIQKAVDKILSSRYKRQITEIYMAPWCFGSDGLINDRIELSVVRRHGFTQDAGLITDVIEADTMLEDEYPGLFTCISIHPAGDEREGGDKTVTVWKP